MEMNMNYPCEPHQLRPDIKTASTTVGLDLESPIDISQMTVHECSVMPSERSGEMRFIRKSDLRTFLEDGDEIIIQITRISQKRPDPTSKPAK